MPTLPLIVPWQLVKRLGPDDGLKSRRTVSTATARSSALGVAESHRRHATTKTTRRSLCRPAPRSSRLRPPHASPRARMFHVKRGARTEGVHPERCQQPHASPSMGSRYRGQDPPARSHRYDPELAQSFVRRRRLAEFRGLNAILASPSLGLSPSPCPPPAEFTPASNTERRLLSCRSSSNIPPSCISMRLTVHQQTHLMA